MNSISQQICARASNFNFSDVCGRLWLPTFCFSFEICSFNRYFERFSRNYSCPGPDFSHHTATVVGIAQNGVDCALLIILCYTGARWIEDYIIVPRVMGHYVELHPLAVIFAVLCGEVMAGALGMLIAIPVAASIKVILDFCYPPVAKN